MAEAETEKTPVCKILNKSEPSCLLEMVLSIITTSGHKVRFVAPVKNTSRISFFGGIPTRTKLVFPFLPPANKVCEGYIFTRVCLSTGGVCPIPCWDTPPPPTEQTPPPGKHPLRASTPWADTPLAQCILGYGKQAGGTYPTEMQACSDCDTSFFKLKMPIISIQFSCPQVHKTI